MGRPKVRPTTSAPDSSMTITSAPPAMISSQPPSLCTILVIMSVLLSFLVLLHPVLDELHGFGGRQTFGRFLLDVGIVQGSDLLDPSLLLRGAERDEGVLGRRKRAD